MAEEKLKKALSEYCSVAMRFEGYLESNRRITAILVDVDAILSKKWGCSSMLPMLDRKTGAFKDGGYAPYAAHPELAGLYAELIHHVEKQRESTWKTSDDGEMAVEEKKAALFAICDLVRKMEGGRRLIDRVKAALWNVDTAPIIAEVL